MPGHWYTQIDPRSILHQTLRIRTLQDAANHRNTPTTPGKIFLSFSAAHAAFGFPPFKQSSKSNRGCRTGFENDTRAESTNVIFRTPHP